MEINYLDLIIDLIINNTCISYSDKSKLRIDDDNAVLEVIKIIAQERYELRLNELSQKQILNELKDETDK